MLYYSYRYVRPEAMQVLVSLQMKFANYLVRKMEMSLRDVKEPEYAKEELKRMESKKIKAPNNLLHHLQMKMIWTTVV